MEPDKPLRLDKGLSDSPVPEPRERVQKPDKASHEGKLRQMDQEIAATRTALTQIKARIDSQTCSDKRSSKALIERLTSQKNQWHEERGQLQTSLANCDSDLAVLKEEQRQLRSRIKTATEQELDFKLEELRSRQEHTTMSLRDEKRILAEIRELEMSRPALIAYIGKGQAVAAKETERSSIREQIKALWANINSTKKQIDEERDKMRKSELLIQSEIPQLKSQRDDLYQRLDSLEIQRKSLLEAFDSQVKAYRKQAKLLRFVQLIEKRLKSGRNAANPEEGKVDPYLHRKEKIDFAIAWFHRLLPRPEAIHTGREGTTAGVVVQEGEEILVDRKVTKGAERGRKKNRKKGKRQEMEEVAMSMEMVAFLAGLRVRAPGNASEIPATITALRQHREALDSQALLAPSPYPRDSSTQPSSKVSPHDDENRSFALRERSRWSARKQ